MVEVRNSKPQCSHCGDPVIGRVLMQPGDRDQDVIERELCNPERGLNCHRLVALHRHKMPCEFCVWFIKLFGRDMSLEAVNALIVSIVRNEPWLLHRPAPCHNVRCARGQWCVGCDPHGENGCEESPWPCDLAKQNPLWIAGEEHGWHRGFDTARRNPSPPQIAIIRSPGDQV